MTSALPLLLTLCLLGQDAGETNQSPLSALPSEPGSHLKRIRSLADNQWLNLGPPAPDPRWGKARGRAWGARAFIPVPELAGAFLFGEGVHAFVKPDGHAMDDLWFYDLNAHRWICLYPGTNTKTFNTRVKDHDLKIGPHGLLVDASGQPIPVHTLIHAWSYLAYDSDRHKFAFLGGDGLGDYFLGGRDDMQEGLDLLRAHPKAPRDDDHHRLFSPWFYDISSGRFERTPATGSLGEVAPPFPQMHYVPSRKKFFVVGSKGIATFDPASNRWTDTRPKGPSPRGYDNPGCYDPSRQRIYHSQGDAELMAYDIDTNTWINLAPEGPGPSASTTNSAFYEYIPCLDLVVAIAFTGERPGVFAYDPKTNRWSAPLPFPPDAPAFRFAANTFYDPSLNAFLCHVAGDSEDNGNIWAYRFKNAPVTSSP